MSDLFKYNDGSDVIPKEAFRISPSQISKFFDETAQWYREHLLNESGFEGSTATELGNCIHVAAQMYTETGHIDHRQILDYIASITNPEVDKSVLYAQYPIMVSTLVTEFLMHNKSTTVQTELFVHAEVLPNVFAAGSIDRYDPNKAGGTISDYKTMGSLDKARLPSSFSRPYYFQQLTYAWILRQQGLPVEYLELVYVTRDNTGRVNEKGKPLKDYPSQVHVIKHPITNEDMEFIESILKLIAESVTLWKSNPEFRHLLAQDMRLKAPPKPKLFGK